MGVKPFEEAMPAGDQREPVIILDMKELIFLSSAGIRSLVSLGKEQRKNNAHLILNQPTEQVMKVLEISGLLSQFVITPLLDEALGKAQWLSKEGQAAKDYHFDQRHYQFTRTSDHPVSLSGLDTGGVTEPDLLIADVRELGMGLGVGSISEARKEAAATASAFLSLPGFFAYIPEGSGDLTDYLHTGNTGTHGVYLNQYLGTCSEPDAYIEILPGQAIESGQLLDDLFSMASGIYRQVPPVLGITGIVQMLNAEGKTEFHWCASWIVSEIEIPRGSALEPVKHFTTPMKTDQGMKYLRQSMLLEGLDTLPPGHQLKQCIDHVFRQEGVAPVLRGDVRMPVLSGKLWIYLPVSCGDLSQQRMKVESADNESFPDDWGLMIRAIYHDTRQVILKKLHGGFTANTYLVDSFDHQGRKRLPTVIKLGNAAMISREEKNYRECVQPFILNNSVSILGSNYYGANGGICYNFVGIGGPEAQLKWLTHLYREREVSDLVPLFDNIFKNILKPWYGQPKWGSRLLFKEHNPVEPLFPNLFADAFSVLGVDEEVQYLDCPWLGRQVLNPYWYLKHEYSRRKDEGLFCYSSFCHGDLNMQNILVDEKDNVYVIDFSETTEKNIVSDFARLEPIFKIEMTRTECEQDLSDKLRFEEAMIHARVLEEKPEFRYEGDDPAVRKAYEMVWLVRSYAKQVTLFEENPLPYWLALLEWTLPYVSYRGVNVLIQKHAVFSAGLICEQIYKSSE